MKKNPNYRYDVDTNDPEALQRAYQKYKKQHSLITLISIIAILFLLLFVFDFYNVNFKNGKPLLTIKSRVENGFLYKGVGYKILICDDGNKYTGFVENKSCNNSDQNSSFKDILKNKFLEYATKNKIINKNALLNLEIIDFKFDEETKNGTIYSVNIKYLCDDENNNCLKTNIEYYDNNNITVYLGVNKYNEIISFDTFRTSGELYNKLKEDYKTKTKSYLIKNNLMNEQQIREYDIRIKDCIGKFKYNNTVYANSYIINITYTCKDNNNTCITYKGINENNLSFEMSVFTDDSNNIVLMDKTNILNK